MPTTETRSLVIAPQWIGDAVMTEPLLRRLTARGERLTVGALPWVAPVYRAMPQVSEVVEFSFPRAGLQFRARQALARQLGDRFDTAYVLPNSLKSALLPFLARIPKRVGYLGEARVGLLTHRLKNPKDRPPMVAFYSALSGQPDVAADRPQLQLPAAQSQAALHAAGLVAGGYVVMAPGAEYGPAKRWPAAHFAQLARLLGRTVVLLGSAKEAALCGEIASLAASAPTATAPTTSAPTDRSALPPDTAPRMLNLAGQTSLADALALIAACDAMVSNDSGLMHVAAALGVRQAALFGSSSPHHTPPLNDRAQVIWLKDDASYQPPLDCAPCFARDCPLGHTRCLNDISAERVFAAL